MKNYAKIIENKEERCFEVSFPDVPGCFTYGHTLDEAIEYAGEALSGVIGCMKDDGESLPEAKVYEGENYYSIEVDFETPWEIIP